MLEFVLDLGSGDGGGCPGLSGAVWIWGWWWWWLSGCVTQALLRRSRVVPCGTAGESTDVLGIFGFRRPVEWMRTVLLRGSCLLGRGARVSFPLGLLGACGSLCRC